MRHSHSLSVPLDEDGYFQFRCPGGASHRFKGMLSRDDVVRWYGAEDSPWWSGPGPLWCPYCGRRGSLRSFAPAITNNIDAVVDEMHQEALREAVRVLNRGLRRSARSVGSIRVSASPVVVPQVRKSPPTAWPEQERSRVQLECGRCGHSSAVYGRASFCWRCGPLHPCQRADIWLESLSRRLTLAGSADLPEQFRELVGDFGLDVGFCEDAVIHGLSAVEAALLDLYRARGGKVAGPRLDFLVTESMGWVGGLEERAELLLSMRTVRNCLVHRAGIIDARMSRADPRWTGREGQRIEVQSAEALQFLDVCRTYVSALRSASDSPANGSNPLN